MSPTSSRLNIDNIDCLTNPSIEDRLECSNVLYDAFSKDRYTNQLYGQNVELRRLSHDIDIRATLVDCEVWVARVKDESVAGGTVIASVACVSPPGKDIFDSHPDKEAMFDDLIECTTDSTAQWYTNHVIPCLGGESTAGFKTETFYIEGFGTRPEYQGRGLGTALLSRLKDHARESGGRLGLATDDERTARLYEKAGFKDIHNAELSYEDGGETVRLRTMCNDCGLESWRAASCEANNDEDGAHQG
ncbi:hypothetical protein B9479_003845 [Cryptococcus floricola]|uniref:N-acetyltransferase domain-containing protein n=1 Tax=Cryptococcus floricola TaxID=2591691 RepID=A0A5D3AVN3_9TREE|nr:hypothetical protein B9479_003845 [Cryptococcus floricola]